MNTPAQALLWKCWRLTRRQLLIQLLFILSACVLLMQFMPADADYLERNGAIKYSVLASVAFLMFSCRGVGYQYGGADVFAGMMGFPFLRECRYPGSTRLLIVVPLVYLCALLLTVYLVPMVLLSIWFNVEGPQFLIAALIVYILLLSSALSWWTSSLLFNSLGWVLLMLLLWNDLLFPAFTLTEESGAIVVESLTEFMWPIIILIAALCLLVVGVHRQRSGEVLLGIDGSHMQDPNSRTPRERFPFSLYHCPTTSPWRAELSTARFSLEYLTASSP